MANIARDDPHRRTRRQKPFKRETIADMTARTTSPAPQQAEIILYQPSETVRIEVRLGDDTVWLTQAQMAELFGTGRQAITKHLQNIYNSNELTKEATSSILEQVRKEGARMVRRKIEIFNLDAIISVGFRVNTKRGIEFRQWANKVLKDYLLRGYAVSQQLRLMEQRIDARLESQQDRLHQVEAILGDHQQKMDFFVRTNLPPVEGIFYDGQLFDAYHFANNLIRKAKQSITLIDNYVDNTVLSMLDKRAAGVAATTARTTGFCSSTTKSITSELRSRTSASAGLHLP